MNETLDLCFALTATTPLPADHGYVLYGALSRLLPALHRENGVAVHPIAGFAAGEYSTPCGINGKYLYNRTCNVLLPLAQRLWASSVGHHQGIHSLTGMHQKPEMFPDSNRIAVILMVAKRR